LINKTRFLVFSKCLVFNLGLHSPLGYLFVSFGHVNYQKFLIVKQLIPSSKFHYPEVIIND